MWFIGGYMKIIKDNSNKEIKVKCKTCKSKLLVKMSECLIGMFQLRYIDCPVCKKTIWIDKY